MRKYRDKILVACILYVFLISPVDIYSAKSPKGCEVEGIGAEMIFAKKVCIAAKNIGLSPELVHSYGAGGVDVFISESE